MNLGSQIKKQRSVIRQGCPLSPYPFVLVMTCVERDISSGITKLVIEARLPGATLDMVFYADDTIVLSRSKETYEELLEQE